MLLHAKYRFKELRSNKKLCLVRLSLTERKIKFNYQELTTITIIFSQRQYSFYKTYEGHFTQTVDKTLR